ncbi:MAG TPA: hypothetical protein VL547_14480 [Dinghuibacter sp.]|jgi:hypothetical protein|uniref:hypothetical protein n=1 Tax=Dinghuibacter sp. TaxID=2024697 RepID=UPI002CB7E7D1|nr:hypothetical protein [Dinghuibacter sp.]HTJ13238.1 hypothetical protein [Dinghuibacter sp.]
MSLPVNNKGKGKKDSKGPGGAAGGSKFISKPTSKATGGGKKIMKTGGTRGS